MSKVVTFIIPAYNMEMFLERCLNSFICLSVLEQIEVIVVDDGSKDSTGKIAQRYAREYPQSFRVIHKENGGHGSAVNTGSQHAQGKYFKVIDADDWVVTRNLPQFVQFLILNNADVILTPFRMVDITNGKQIEKNIDIKEEKNSFTLQEVLENLMDFEPCLVFHGITYRTEFYRKSNYRLSEHIFYEDQEYSTIPLCNAKSIMICPIYIYQYMVGNAQQSIAYDNQAKRINHLEEVIRSLMQYYCNTKSEAISTRKYLLYKIETVVLIYYLTACVYEKNKKNGRRLAKKMKRRLIEFLPDIQQRTKKKYCVYIIMNWLHVTPGLYQIMLESPIYSKFKHLYKKR